MIAWKQLDNMIANLPIGLCAICVSLCTLGNIFILLQLHYLKIIALAVSMITVIGISLKFLLHPKQSWEEFQFPSIGCFYPTFGMLLMCLASSLVQTHWLLGKLLWLCGIVFCFVISAIFFYLNIIKYFELKNVTPGWFVTFCGVLMAAVTGEQMHASGLIFMIFCFALFNYVWLLPLVIHRLNTRNICLNIYPSLAIFPAPPSLLLIAYLTQFAQPNLMVACGLLAIIQISLIAVYVQLDTFFHLKFSHAFASLTLPLAAACMALVLFSQYLQQKNYLFLSTLCFEIAGLQLLVAVAVIIVVFCRVFDLLKSEHFSDNKRIIQ